MCPLCIKLSVSWHHLFVFNWSLPDNLFFWHLLIQPLKPGYRFTITPFLQVLSVFYTVADTTQTVCLQWHLFCQSPPKIKILSLPLHLLPSSPFTPPIFPCLIASLGHSIHYKILSSFLKGRKSPKLEFAIYSLVKGKKKRWQDEASTTKSWGLKHKWK